MNDQRAEREPAAKGLRDPSGSSNQTAGFCSAVGSSAAMTAKAEKVKRAEESLRTIMYLSCWGPN